MHPSRQRCTHRAVLVSRPAIYPRKVQTAREWPPLQLAFFIGVSRCRIEEALYVGLYHISIPPVLQVKGQVTDRIPCPASGPVPITAPQKLRLIDRIQEPGTSCLEEFILDHRNAQRPLLAVALWNVSATNQLRPVPLLLQALYQCLDIGLQGLCIPLPRHSIPPPGRFRIQVAPAVQEELDIQAPVKVPQSVLLVDFRLVGYAPQGGGLACFRSNGVRRKFPVRAASFRHVLPHVRGFPPLGVLGVIRLPNGLRRAFPFTVLLRLPDTCSTSQLRFRHRSVSGFPLPCLNSRIPASNAFHAQEPMGPPKFFDVSLPACRGLWTPADLHILATSDALVWPSVSVKTLGVRSKLISKLYQHFRVRGHPYGLQDALSTRRPSCSPWYPPRLRHGRKTRYGWVASPYPTGSFTLQETPSFSWRDNTAAQPRLEAEAERTLPGVGSSAMILIEAPSSAYHPGMLGVGNRNEEEEETSCDFTPNNTRRTVASICTPGRCISAS